MACGRPIGHTFAKKTVIQEGHYYGTLCDLNSRPRTLVQAHCRVRVVVVEEALMFVCTSIGILGLLVTFFFVLFVGLRGLIRRVRGED